MDIRGIIDRFEGDMAIVELEDGRMHDIYRYQLPPGAVEGSAILIKERKVLLLNEETERRKKNISKLMDDLFAD